MDTANEEERVPSQTTTAPTRVTRRFFLRGSGTAVAGGIGTIAGWQGAWTQEAPGVTPVPVGEDPVPETPEAPPEPSLRFFRPDEAMLVDAIAARLIPGTADDPGGREAGVAYYIDGLLAHGDGFARPTYRQPPWAMIYEGDTPPPEAGQNGASAIWVQADRLSLYGFQSQMTPRETYQSGLPAVNRYATGRFGANFVDLSEPQHDQILAEMEDGVATGFDAPSASDFFTVLHDHAIEGFFSDPVYGGNRDMVGWKLVGFPGALRGYSPWELKTEGTTRQPMSMADLHHFHAGKPEDGPVLPVRGSEEYEGGHEH
jgi:gluconate 2-dehydrogenase gamma chain